MLERVGTVALAVPVGLAVLVQILAAGSSLIAVVAGLVLVVGGTALTVRFSHSNAALAAVIGAVKGLRANPSGAAVAAGADPAFLTAARHYRHGKIRPAEAATGYIADPLLRRGTQLVLDGFSREQVLLAMQRLVAEERDRLRVPVEVLRAMGGYAPTLGMLGTLLGLVQMLFGLGTGDARIIGSSMGFAMLTTVYGLAIANLLFKPLASKLDSLGRVRILGCVARMQAVLLLYDREHADVLRELLEESEPDAGARARDGVTASRGAHHPPVNLMAAG